jgi:hypothetical protein
MEDGKSLSKNLMYAPLVAYHKSANSTIDDNSGGSSTSIAKHPSQYTSENRSVSKAFTESSLVSLLHFSSCDYHRKRATVNDAKNNGSRPLGLSDMEDRIRQKAVTLVGGGINTSIPIPKTKIQSKKRRHRSWEEVEPVLKKLSSSSSSAETLESESGHVVSFLQKLNSAWNEYASKLLLKDRAKNRNQRISDDDLKEIEVRLGALTRSGIHNTTRNRVHSGDNGRSANDFMAQDHIDFIGAHVQVKSCKAHVSWEGKFGVLIGETKNTYRIASFARRRKLKKATTKASSPEKQREVGQIRDTSGFRECSNSGTEKSTDDFEGKTQRARSDVSNSGLKPSSIEILVLPKLESSLILILPFVSSKINEGDSNDQDLSLEPEDVNLDSMISVPDEAIGICIAAPENMV